MDRRNRSQAQRRAQRHQRISDYSLPRPVFFQSLPPRSPLKSFRPFGACPWRGSRLSRNFIVCCRFLVYFQTPYRAFFAQHQLRLELSEAKLAPLLAPSPESSSPVVLSWFIFLHLPARFYRALTSCSARSYLPAAPLFP